MGVLFKEIEHIIDRQYAAEQAFLAEYAAGSYTIENPYVCLLYTSNPENTEGEIIAAV